jgi:phosphoserine phosphatase RsbU/P
MSPETKKSILIIDDDITVRKLISFHLEKNNYNVFSAEGPDEGFQFLHNEKVDIVLCDVSMDGMDGFSFCRKVRENEKFRVLPFIFVTARSSFEDKSRVLEAGGDDIVTKPFEIQELILKIQMLIRRSDIYKVYGIKKNLEKTFAQSIPRLLLVDDDPSMARLFLYNLEKAGYECRFAESAAEGYKTARDFLPDIIISDIMMPETDGFGFRKMLLNDNILKNTPFVFLSAKGGEDDILNGYELGINDYVVKTAGPKVVLAKINAILKSLGKERQKVVTELHEAADSLRVKVVPDHPPLVEGYEINQWHQSFQGVPGGDFIDYYSLDENNIAIIVGDVMGKKWGAWYFAFAYAGYVRSALRGVLQNTKTYSPSVILQNVNNSVYQDAKISEVFATISVVFLDTSRGVLSYAGAGDLPIVYRNKKSGEVKQIDSKGLLLGFAAEGRYKDYHILLQEGDSVFIVTDGIIESRNKEGNQFGYERLSNLIKSIDDEKNIIEKIKKEMEDFTSGSYEDDVSLITITSKRPPENTSLEF